MLVTKSPLYKDSSQSCRLNYGGALIFQRPKGLSSSAYFSILEHLENMQSGKLSQHTEHTCDLTVGGTYFSSLPCPNWLWDLSHS